MIKLSKHLSRFKKKNSYEECRFFNIWRWLRLKSLKRESSRCKKSSMLSPKLDVFCFVQTVINILIWSLVHFTAKQKIVMSMTGENSLPTSNMDKWYIKDGEGRGREDGDAFPIPYFRHGGPFTFIKSSVSRIFVFL